MRIWNREAPSASFPADPAGGTPLRDRLGVCRCFHYQAYRDVEVAVEQMRVLGIRHLSTGISWADYHRPGGKRWYDWQMARLAEFDVLLSVWHTPPSLAAGPPGTSMPG